MKIGMSGIVWIAVVAGAGWLAFSISGCDNPFQTRTPEPPSRSQSTWILPHSPGIVFTNLRYAIAELNVVNYTRCFADSAKTGRRFRFFPEATVDNARPGLFIGWSLEQERAYFSRLIDALPVDSVRSLRLDSLQAEIAGDSAMFLQRYTLVARHELQGSRGGIPGRVSGEGRFWLIKDRFGEWAIYRWADFASGDASTWSTLKADFFSR